MAVRGAEAKQKIINQIILEFPGAFLCNDNKELRIPVAENGERVEIKVALTCAKENIIDSIDEDILGADGQEALTDSPTMEEQASLRELLLKIHGQKY